MTPAGRLPPQDWMRAAGTRRVVEALTAEGAEVRFVGGCVRDALSGRPVKDVDLATPLPPEQVMRLLTAAGIKTVPTGLAHGTVTAVVHHKPFEITTLREDTETYGRHARVAFTDDWTADAARRDFTFNALSLAPDGTLFDPFGGAADLRAGRVRFVGDARARIREDYLRLLRFFRFQAHYGREPPDPAVLDITAELAPALRRLSGERIREELFKLLRAPDPAPVIDLMIERRIFRELLPVADDAAVLGALVRIEPGDAPPDPVLRLAAILDAGQAEAQAPAQRLRLSKVQRERLADLMTPPARVRIDLAPRDLRRVLYRLGAARVRDLLLLDAARRRAAGAAASEKPLARRLDAALAETDAWRPVTFPLKGRDGLALGIAQGPELGRLLDRVEAWWADADFRPSREDCLTRLRELIAAG
ncbi:MAG: CCA tRNA nucleotidyltransferase [Kiloniellaceae bacterium]